MPVPDLGRRLGSPSDPTIFSPAGVSERTVNPSSSSGQDEIGAASVTSGPVPIEVQKQVDMATAHSTATTSGGVTSRGVVGVTRRPRAQDALLDIEGGELAGPHPDEGEASARRARPTRRARRHSGRSSGDPRRVGEPLPRGDADAIVERAVAALLLKAVCARLAVGAPADRQLLDAGDLRRRRRHRRGSSDR